MSFGFDKCKVHYSIKISPKLDYGLSFFINCIYLREYVVFPNINYATFLRGMIHARELLRFRRLTTCRNVLI